MARKFDIQLKQWLPVIIESYFTYETLNTFEIVKHSGAVLRTLGQKEHVKEITDVLEFLVKTKYLFPKDIKSVKHFGVDFSSYTYDVSDKFKDFIREGQDRAKQPNPDDLISKIEVENITQNTVNVYNFNLTFALEKLIGITLKAGLVNF